MKLAPRMFTNAIRAIGRKFWTICTLGFGKMFVGDVTRANRLRKCLLCEHYEDGQCDLCLCFVEIKVRFADEACPDKPPKWKSKV